MTKKTRQKLREIIASKRIIAFITAIVMIFSSVVLCFNYRFFSRAENMTEGSLNGDVAVNKPVPADFRERINNALIYAIYDCVGTRNISAHLEYDEERDRVDIVVDEMEPISGSYYINTNEDSYTNWEENREYFETNTQIMVNGVKMHLKYDGSVNTGRLSARCRLNSYFCDNCVMEKMAEAFPEINEMPITASTTINKEIALGQLELLFLETPSVKLVYKEGPNEGEMVDKYVNAYKAKVVSSAQPGAIYNIATEQGIMQCVPVYILSDSSVPPTDAESIDMWTEDPGEIEIDPLDITPKHVYVMFKDVNKNRLIKPTLFTTKDQIENIEYTNDVDAPLPPVVELVEDEGIYTKINDFNNDDSEPYIVNKNATFYKITVSDGNGEGVDTLTYGGQQYPIVNNVALINVNLFNAENNNIVLTDKVGNSTTENYPLRKVSYIDRNSENVVYYTIGTNETILEGSVHDNGASPSNTFAMNDYTCVKGSNSLRINLSITSPYDISEIEIIGNGRTLYKENSGFTRTIDDAHHTFDYIIPQIEINTDGSNRRIENLRIKVTYAKTDDNHDVGLGNVCVDGVAPNKPDIVLERFDGQDWNICNDGFVDTNPVNVNPNDYRYLITNVADNAEGTGFDSSIENFIKVADGNTWEATSRTGTISKLSDGRYAYVFNQDDFDIINSLSGQETYVNYVVVRDRAGNENYAVSPEVKKLNTEIGIYDIVLKDENGNVLLFGDENLSVANGYKLYVTVSSGYPLETEILGLEDGDNVTDIFGLSKETSFNDTDGYVAQLVFDIPARNAKMNELYDSMVLFVKDSQGNSKKETLGKLIYDSSKPYVSILEYPTNWVKLEDAKVVYKIVAGSNSVESLLSYASYKIGETVYDVTPINAKETEKLNVNLPETVNPAEGTTISFDARDNAGNTITDFEGTKPYAATLLVDGHNPVIDSVLVNGKISQEIPLSGVPVINTTFRDNLAIGKAVITVTYPDGKCKSYSKTYSNVEAVGIDVVGEYSFAVDSVNGMAADGNYKVEVIVYDKAGNASEIKEANFKVDNTIPEVSIGIKDGIKGGKSLRVNNTDYYYRSNVTVKLEVLEDNFDGKQVSVYDKSGNGSISVPVSFIKTGDRYVAEAVIEAEGAHEISIAAKDATGNQALSKSVSFYIDKTRPVINTTINGLNYSESMGELDVISDANLKVHVDDETLDKNDFKIQIIKKEPGQVVGNPEFVKTDIREFTFAKEADYEVNMSTSDMAGNVSDVKTVKFRVDKTAPEVSIVNAPNGGTVANSVTFRCSVDEAFWWDASARITIYRRAGDGQSESVYRTIDVVPTGFSTSRSETLTESGAYRIVFTANDRAGHRTEATQQFTIDNEAPVISISGVNNYDLTDKTVEFIGEVNDKFFATLNVSVTGTVKDINGEEKELDFSELSVGGNPAYIAKTFTEDGIYDIHIEATDRAGNNVNESIHFTVDKSAPAIKLPDFVGGVTNKFSWIVDSDELVTDLTVCETHIFINGKEYDGKSEIADGAYNILIVSTDEVGHKSEAEFSFVLDTKAPVFIVTGVEDGERKKETYNITISLQLEEDELKEVTLNGSLIKIVDNQANITVDTDGEYILTMVACDEAGNTSSKTLNFVYGEKRNHVWVWFAAMTSVMSIGAGGLIVIKKIK